MKKQCPNFHYGKMAVGTFIAGSIGTLRNNLHLKRPASHEGVIVYVNEFDKFEKTIRKF